jgi:hypothetical protein
MEQDLAVFAAVADTASVDQAVLIRVRSCSTTDYAATLIQNIIAASERVRRNVVRLNVTINRWMVMSVKMIMDFDRRFKFFNLCL